MKKELTQNRLKELMHYDHKTGIFTRIINSGNKKTGDVVGSLSKDLGYLVTNINGRIYYMHRLAFLYIKGHFPKNHTDHINHNKTDNRFINLLEVTHAENHKNLGVRSDNKSGVSGVSFHKAKNKWRTVIIVNYKQKHIGYYKNLEDAILARKGANIKYGYHVNHGISKP